MCDTLCVHILYVCVWGVWGQGRPCVLLNLLIQNRYEASTHRLNVMAHELSGPVLRPMAALCPLSLLSALNSMSLCRRKCSTSSSIYAANAEGVTLCFSSITSLSTAG